MIKLEHVVLPSPEQMEFVIEGMRNPMNSWEKSDSHDYKYQGYPVDRGYFIGPNDLDLMKRLSKAGAVHRKYMRMIPVMVRITAPLYWWKEFDTYKVGTVANSCSTMHKIQAKEFTLEDFSCEHLFEDDSIPYLEDTILILNKARAYFITLDEKIKKDKLTHNEKIELIEKRKEFWWQMIQLLPSSYNQTRNVMLNYEVLAAMYEWRKDHKLDEWREFCKWIEELPYSELITNSYKKMEEPIMTKELWIRVFNILLGHVEDPTMCDTFDIECWLNEQRDKIIKED